MAKDEMDQQRRRRYAEGDRVRVWRKPGERARIGTVASVREGAIKVRYDDQGGTSNANPSYMRPYIEPRRRLRQGILITTGTAVVVVVVAVILLGWPSLAPVARGVLFLCGVVALYFGIRGVLVIRDGTDPLRPLGTHDPTKDNSPTWVD